MHISFHQSYSFDHVACLYFVIVIKILATGKSLDWNLKMSRVLWQAFQVEISLF